MICKSNSYVVKYDINIVFDFSIVIGAAEGPGTGICLNMPTLLEWCEIILPLSEKPKYS